MITEDFLDSLSVNYMGPLAGQRFHLSGKICGPVICEDVLTKSVMKNQGITEANRIHLLGIMNVCINF